MSETLTPAVPVPPATATTDFSTMRPDRRPKGGAYWLYLVPGGVLFTLIIGIPFVMNIYLSFTKWSGVGDPRWIGVKNYTKLLHDDIFWMSFRNTLAMIIAMVVVPTLLGLLLAAILFDSIGRRFPQSASTGLRAAFYLPQVLPVVVAGIVWSWILQPDGALNALFKAIGLDSLAHDWLGDPKTALATVMVMMIWVQIGYPVVIFMAALQRVDPELYEAAELDGAGWFRRFRAITIPQIRPETFVVSLTCTIAALKVFGPIFALTRGGPDNATNVPSYFSYYTFFKKLNVGYGSAISTVLTVLIILVSVIFIRVQNASQKRDEEI
jgi:raffinose/stachyose/melibiose transport system permease protein